jgi:hypothetical protein
LFLITYITSIPAFFVLYAPVLDDPRYILGGGVDNRVLTGSFNPDGSRFVAVAPDHRRGRRSALGGPGERLGGSDPTAGSLSSTSIDQTSSTGRHTRSRSNRIR